MFWKGSQLSGLLDDLRFAVELVGGRMCEHDMASVRVHNYSGSVALPAHICTVTQTYTFRKQDSAHRPVHMHADVFLRSSIAGGTSSKATQTSTSQAMAQCQPHSQPWPLTQTSGTDIDTRQQTRTRTLAPYMYIHEHFMIVPLDSSTQSLPFHTIFTPFLTR